MGADPIYRATNLFSNLILVDICLIFVDKCLK